jgi:hypothetical protein
MMTMTATQTRNRNYDNMARVRTSRSNPFQFLTLGIPGFPRSRGWPQHPVIPVTDVSLRPPIQVSRYVESKVRPSAQRTCRSPGPGVDGGRLTCSPSRQLYCLQLLPYANHTPPYQSYPVVLLPSASNPTVTLR